MPLGSPGHAVQLAPQAAASSSAEQPEPQRWYPTLQVKSHAVPLQVAADDPTGRGQLAQEVAPQLLMLVFETQVPAQSCVPAVQVPSQGAVSTMQAP